MERRFTHIAAGVAAAAALPVGEFALGLPLALAIPAAVAVYAGTALAFTLGPRARPAPIDFARIDRAQSGVVADLLKDGEAQIARLRAASRQLRSVTARPILGQMADAARKILDRLAAEPGKLASVRRFLTYYLPRSAEIAEGLVTIERQRNADMMRLVETEAMLARLGRAFLFYADAFDKADIETLDVEMKLVDRALAEDLGAAEPRIPPSSGS